MIHQPDLVRPSVSAGRYYPPYPDELRAWLTAQLDRVPLGFGTQPIAVLTPHGDQPGHAHIAAAAYAAVQGFTYKRVIVCAPSHHERFRYASVFSGRAYETPLGEVAVDTDFCDRLCTRCRVALRGDLAHWPSREYSLEVQLPFLQFTVGDFKLVPIVFGDLDEAAVQSLGGALAALIGESPGDSLLVVTSDLSHFHREAAARRMDVRTLESVRTGQVHDFLEGVRIGDYEACGAAGIAMLMEAVARLQAKASPESPYDTSLAATGDPVSVVGYGSLIFRTANGA